MKYTFSRQIRSNNSSTILGKRGGVGRDTKQSTNGTFSDISVISYVPSRFTADTSASSEDSEERQVKKIKL